MMINNNFSHYFSQTGEYTDTHTMDHIEYVTHDPTLTQPNPTFRYELSSFSSFPLLLSDPLRLQVMA